MLTNEQRDRIWNGCDNDCMLTPHVDTEEGSVPFGCLRERLQEKVLYWLACNVYPVPPFNNWGGESSAPPRTKAPAAFITSHELGGLLYHYTGIILTAAQVQEALLLLGIEPLDGNTAVWEYRGYQSSPCVSVTSCVSIVTDGSTTADGSAVIDNRPKVGSTLRVAAVTITPLCSTDEHDESKTDAADDV